MKKVVVIGSDIARKIAGGLPSEKYRIVGEYISINPLSFAADKPRLDIELPQVNKEAYANDVRNDVFEKIQLSNPDLIIIDLLDCRLNVNRYLLGKVPVTATENNGLAGAVKNLKFRLKNTVSPFDTGEGEWFEIFRKYKAKLLNSAPGAKIIVADVRCALKYILHGKKIRSFYPEEYGEKLYDLFGKVYGIMRAAAPEFTCLKGFDLYYCNAEENARPFSYALQKEFYSYACTAVDMLCEGADMAEADKLRDRFNEISVNAFRNTERLEALWRTKELNNFCGIYSDEFGNYIDTPDSTVNIILNGYCNKIVLGKGVSFAGGTIELGECNSVTISDGVNFRGGTLIKTGDDNVITIGKDCAFEDFSVVTKSKNLISFGEGNRFIKGCLFGVDYNCAIECGNNNEFWTTEVHLFNRSALTVGSSNFFNKRITVTCHSYTKTVVHDCCMLASEVEIIAGDGHSIFDIVTGKKVNDMLKRGDVIELYDHVWVCRRALLLGRAGVAQGCIVAAGAIVNKPFTVNNCLIAGVPAKLKKKNICWCRNNTSADIEDCAPYNKPSAEKKI